MLLSARILQNCTDVNTWDYPEQLSFTQGDTVDVYFVIMDAGTDRVNQGFVPAGRRYIPAVGATLNVTLTNLDPTQNITRPCENPFTDPDRSDCSIWTLSILASDMLYGLVNMQLQLNEGGKITNGFLQGAFMVVDGSVSGCGC